MKRTVPFLLFLLLLSQGVPACAEPVGPAPTRIQGTFIQLTAEHGDWDSYDWGELFDCFRKLGLSTVIVQWTVLDGIGFHPTRMFDSVRRPPLPAILRLAEEAGIDVFVGLLHDSQYWERIRQDPELVEVYLGRIRRQTAALVDELVPDLLEYKSFRGWYIPQEIDDQSWQHPELQRLLFSFLAQLSAELREATPTRPVALSGFTNAALDPQSFEDFWRDLFKETAVDIVLFQDGIGAGKLNLKELRVYFEALKRAVKARGRRLFPVVEIFEQKGGPPLDEGLFRAEPASLVRINKQLQLAGEFSETIVAFSVPDYMSPLAGPMAGMLLESYLKQRKNDI